MHGSIPEIKFNVVDDFLHLPGGQQDAQSSSLMDSSVEQLVKPKHRIVKVSQSDSLGTFDKVTPPGQQVQVQMPLVLHESPEVVYKSPDSLHAS